MRSYANQSEIHNARDAFEQFRLALGRADWRRMSFFLGVPTILALYGALNNMGSIESDGFGYTLIFYIAHAYVPWWVTCLMTRLMFITLARWQPAAPVLWVSGAALSCVVLIPYLSWIGMALGGPQGIEGSAISAGEFAIHFSRAVGIWVLINFLFERFVGLPRYRYGDVRARAKNNEKNISVQPIEHLVAEPEPSTVDVADIPEFLVNTGKVSAVEDLFSVSAEEHYIRVHTPSGDALVYKRFKDALSEMDAMNGIRIHRSHWVSPYAVRGVIRDGKRMAVRLKDGNELPVSRPYQALVKSLAHSCHQP